MLLCLVPNFTSLVRLRAKDEYVDNEHNPHYEKPLSMCMHLNISGRITVLCHTFLLFFRKKELKPPD